MSLYTLRFPAQIAREIGLHTNEINAFKGQGCRFFGRKTCVAWVREYLGDITNPKKKKAKAKESESERAERPRRSTGNRRGE